MFNLIEEMAALTQTLNDKGVPYALCGGLAMAVHAFPRATVDIDLLVTEDSLSAVKQIATELGYEIEARPMIFAGGKVRIERVSKLDADSPEYLSLDLLIATPETKSAFDSRIQVQWKKGTLWVVSKEGLIALKQLRGSGQDHDDIQKLQANQT